MDMITYVVCQKRLAEFDDRIGVTGDANYEALRKDVVAMKEDVAKIKEEAVTGEVVEGEKVKENGIYPKYYVQEIS